MIVLLLVLPLVAAALGALLPRLATAAHLAAVPATLAAGLVVAVGAVRGTPAVALDGLLRADALSGWMIGVIVVVAALAGAEAPRYAREGSPRLFYPLFHLMVFTMLLAVSTDDVGLMWVAVEGTTLASVFLVNFERTRASLEAAYKYLLICSVGIAIAFLGTVLVYYAEAVRQQGVAEHAPLALRWTTLLGLAPALSPRVLQLAFVFVVVGYGTKAGLAPMHTWLPDAHSEAPAPVSALMSGVLLSVGVYAILRFKPIVDAAAGPAFAQRILVVLGLLSLAVAAAFLWNPGNYKRMLAYSSVEHMGILVLGASIGGVALFGSLLHVINNGFAKGVLFLSAANIHRHYGSKSTDDVRGALRAVPASAWLFLLGFLAASGTPPFGPFLSELTILRTAVSEGRTAVAAAFLALLLLVFVGMGASVLAVVQGEPPAGRERRAAGERIQKIAPIALLLVLVLGLGLWLPPPLESALWTAARFVEGRP
jgi:hydrogenase-4 component F